MNWKNVLPATNNPEIFGYQVVVDEDENIQNIKTFGYYEKEERYTLKDFEEKELPSQLASLVCRNIFRNQGESYPESFNAVDIQGDIKIYLYFY